MGVQLTLKDSRHEFLLVAAVGRCKFRLDQSSMGVILQSALGGSAADFRPKQIADRVFEFVVHSKAVGFFIYNLRFF